MDTTALRILSRRVSIGALAIVKDADRIPIAASLTEEIRGVEIVAGTIGENADSAVSADACRPWTHPVSESLGERKMRAIRHARIGVFPSGTICIVAALVDDCPEAAHVAEPL